MWRKALLEISSPLTLGVSWSESLQLFDLKFNSINDDLGFPRWRGILDNEISTFRSEFSSILDIRILIALITIDFAATYSNFPSDYSNRTAHQRFLECSSGQRANSLPLESHLEIEYSLGVNFITRTELERAGKNFANYKNEYQVISLNFLIDFHRIMIHGNYRCSTFPSDPLNKHDE